MLIADSWPLLPSRDEKVRLLKDAPQSTKPYAPRRRHRAAAAPPGAGRGRRPGDAEDVEGAGGFGDVGAELARLRARWREELEVGGGRE